VESFSVLLLPYKDARFFVAPSYLVGGFAASRNQ
jgi:hypothetical protein